MKTQEINYSLGDQNFKAYVAHPELDKAPLILIAHTWAGKDDFVELKARELAEEGFIAMAVDMYGDGRVGSSTEENQSMMAPLVDDREKLKSVINAALQAGKELEGVESNYLKPRDCWESKDAYDQECEALSQKFKDNFKRFDVPQEIIEAGPK